MDFQIISARVCAGGMRGRAGNKIVPVGGLNDGRLGLKATTPCRSGLFRRPIRYTEMKGPQRCDARGSDREYI